jgi:hypothetical protein
MSLDALTARMLQTFATFAALFNNCKMKRSLILFIASLAILSAAILGSCTKEPKSPGMLTLRVISPQSGPVPWEKVYLATSPSNLQAHVYVQETMTSDSGYAKFDTLTPGLYWYDTEHWEDYGATEVFLNIDSHAILWVNTPAGPNK